MRIRDWSSDVCSSDLSGVPLYNADVEEEEGIPQSVADLKEAIAKADGLLLATPEYNNSIPGVFKNAIDWASRPPADIPRVFAAKRSEEHTSELQSLMRISYAVFCLKKKT